MIKKTKTKHCPLLTERIFINYLSWRNRTPCFQEQDVKQCEHGTVSHRASVC